MPRLWRSLLGRPEERADPTISMVDWYEQMTYQGLGYLLSGTTTSNDTESIENSFLGYIHGLYKSNGIVFACMEARRSVFSQARFQFQRITNGRPGDLFGSGALALLENPWPNGTTGELLSRAIQDVDLSGNHYVVREKDRLRRLRPDWVQIVLNAPPDTAVQSDVLGYAYWPGGINHGQPTIYMPEEMAHWCPIPDPEAQYRGMSWLTPVLREIQADKQATDHKAKFYANAATPKLAVSVKENVTKAQFLELMEAFEASNGGVENAYKTMYLGGGTDVSIVGANMQQLDFKQVQGAGETRIAAAAGVPSVVVGFSEGMQGSSLNAGNYKSAKESFGDKTLRSLWQSVSASYQSLVQMPTTSRSVRLWYDDRDIAFLRTDRLEAAKIMTEDSASVIKFVQGGFTPESSVSAVSSGDLTLLEHTGLVSVQLLPPGATPPGAAPVEPAAPPALPSGEKPKELPPGGGDEGKVPGRNGWVMVDTKRYAIEARHGSLGDPGYHKLHPGNRGRGGLRQLGPPRGGALGSADYTEEEQLQALEDYIDAPTVNAYLRKGKSVQGETEEKEKKTARALNDLIDIQEPLAEETTVLRGGNKLPAMNVGDEFDDRGFTSGTTDEAIADLFAMAPMFRGEGSKGDTLHITMPKGTQVLEIYSVYPHGNEEEWVLPPGTTYRVTAVNDDGYDVEVVL